MNSRRSDTHYMNDRNRAMVTSKKAVRGHPCGARVFKPARVWRCLIPGSLPSKQGSPPHMISSSYNCVVLAELLIRLARFRVVGDGGRSGFPEICHEKHNITAMHMIKKRLMRPFLECVETVASKLGFWSIFLSKLGWTETKRNEMGTPKCILQAIVTSR
eukprot:1778112-Amphidinium_carterae.2